MYFQRRFHGPQLLLWYCLPLFIFSLPIHMELQSVTALWRVQFRLQGNKADWHRNSKTPEMRQTIKTCWNRILKSFAYNIRTKTSISLFYRFEFGLCILLKWFLFKRPHPSICIFLLQTFILFIYLASVHHFFFSFSICFTLRTRSAWFAQSGD